MGSIIEYITSGMASATNEVVVWEFDENGRWIPYDPTVTRYIEHHYANFVSNKRAVNGTRLPPAGDSAMLTKLDLEPIDHMLGDYYVDLDRKEQIQKTPGACQCLCVDFA